MTSLREACIEAMARAWVEYEGDEWDDLNAPGMAAIKACVEREFDALLATLTQHTQDWADWNATQCADDNEGCSCVTDAQVAGLLEVLKAH